MGLAALLAILGAENKVQTIPLICALAYSLPMAFWTAEREDQLRALVADGKTAREIALELGCSRLIGSAAVWPLAAQAQQLQCW